MIGLQGFQEFMELIGQAGQHLLDALDYVFGWMFTTDGTGLTHWPVLISFILMLIVFVVQTIRRVIHGV